MRPLPKPSAVSAWRLVDNPPPSREGCWSRGCRGRRCPDTNRGGCHSSAFLSDNSEQLPVGPGGAYKYPPIIRQARTVGPPLQVTGSPCAHSLHGYALWHQDRGQVDGWASSSEGLEPPPSAAPQGGSGSRRAGLGRRHRSKGSMGPHDKRGHKPPPVPLGNSAGSTGPLHTPRAKAGATSTTGRDPQSPSPTPSRRQGFWCGSGVGRTIHGPAALL